MSDRRTWIVLMVFVLLAFCIQVTQAAELQISVARPNLMVLSLLVGCLFLDAGNGAVLGFICGALEASFAGYFVGSILVSRSIIGFALGALEERVFRDNILVAMLLSLLGTVAVESLFFLFAPQPHVARWSARIAGEAIYNGVLALPSYALLRRFIRGGRPRGLAALI